jgi:IS30 family transposase
MRKTLMLDNGKEFSQFKQVEEKTGFWIYFSSSNSCKVLKIKTTNK